MKSNQIVASHRQSVVYDVPKELPEHLCGSRHRLKINGQTCFIYQTEVTCGAHQQIGFAEYASFAWHGKTEILIDVNIQLIVLKFCHPEREYLPCRTDDK